MSRSSEIRFREANGSSWCQQGRGHRGHTTSPIGIEEGWTSKDARGYGNGTLGEDKPGRITHSIRQHVGLLLRLTVLCCRGSGTAIAHRVTALSYRVTA